MSVEGDVVNGSAAYPHGETHYGESAMAKHARLIREAHATAAMGIPLAESVDDVERFRRIAQLLREAQEA